MSFVNTTKLQPSVFLLTGIPGLEEVYVWISIPFCLIYIISIVGNSLILFIIITEPNLHEPMYIFLSMLAITDLGVSISTMPTTMGIFLFNSKEISHDACFAQMFFIQSFQNTESSVLLAMAFDRFLAICNPLRYATILTPPIIAKIGFVCLLRSMAVIFPFPILLKQRRYCQANVLTHSYCLHQDVMKLACSDIRVNVIYGFFVIISSLGLDFLLILLSYVIILKTVLSNTSSGKCHKALNTCVSHICIVLLCYIPSIALAVLYRFVKNPSPLVQNFLGNVFLLIPPLMNPIVYSVKTKSIRERIIMVFIN